MLGSSTVCSYTMNKPGYVHCSFYDPNPSNSPPQSFTLEKLDTMGVFQHDPKTVRAPRYVGSREYMFVHLP